MPCVVPSPADPCLHRLRVEVEADPNCLLRLLEPFVVADVLPHRLDCAREDDRLVVHLAFRADGDLAQRLIRRLGAMVPVRQVSALAGEDAAALSAAA